MGKEKILILQTGTKTGQAGFTFVEVLVAITILGIALAVVLNGMSTVTAWTHRTLEGAIIAVLAEGVTAELRAGFSVPNQGRFEPPFSRFSWAKSGTMDNYKITVQANGI